MHLHLRKFWPALLLLLVSTSSWAENHIVTVGGTYGGGGYNYPVLMFSPSTLTINAGDTVTFNSAGGAPHNVDADANQSISFRCANGCDGAGGNGTPSANNWTSTVTFGPETAGHTITYHCDIHGSMGMTGSITVNAAQGSGNVPITAGFTGAWYDPNQSGHGLFIEVEANNQILVWWFTFNPDGTQQAWFGNVGAIDPATNTATVDAVQTQGGQWIPNFNPANITQPPWGTLTLTFTDCNHGVVNFNSTVTGYGQGHMDLTRLTQPAGLTCP
ncbi:MAG TPA: plastocyanin/azurin family copper-binding protein [Pseudomonadales bacterium]|nr:plastocyanin/azurin family copper-binding protein [Pseudomonadales bacterium]